MLRVDGLRVRYGRIVAVHDVSFEVKRGEIVGLIGPNGAGKTSTLSAVAGLVKPDRGSIELEGESIAGHAPERVARRRLALVPEGRQIFQTLTVADNLRLGSTTRKDRRAVAEDLEAELERFPALRKYYDGPAGKLSGGEQQQLAIARALLGRPRILLLDEPSLGLAPLVVDTVFQVLTDLCREGVTVVLVEQNAARTMEVADRCYVLQTGRVVASGSGSELARDSDVASAYLGVA
jgi:branched-chain amino acid transport system ATP-binding protein